MKKIEDMTIEEQVDYVTGRLIMAIGQGKFRDEVALWIIKFQEIGSNYGYEQALKNKRNKK